MMPTMPGQASAHQWTIRPGSGHHGVVDRQRLSPAQRIALTIALTIALINRGFDLLDKVARMSLAGCTRGAIRSRHGPEPGRHPSLMRSTPGLQDVLP